MGNCLSIICPCFFGSPRYSKIPETKVIDHSSFPVAKYSTHKENELVSMGGSKLKDSLPVFEGAWIEEKFSNKSSYLNKFVWINRVSKTLNVSDHAHKERKRQEASLTDVVSVVAGKPDKFKVEPGGSQEFKDGHLCLSVKFMRGGIDMKFKTEAERDSWLAGIVETWKQ